MPTTPNKGYEIQTTGSNTGTWGDVLNDDMISIVDSNLGGLVQKSLSNIDVNLSTEESQAVILRLTGTITANILVTTECVGFFFVENLTTGSFSVTVTNGVAGVVAPQSSRMTMISDTTNGVRIASQASAFAAGTRMVFNSTSAPTSWTKESGAAYNDAAFRLVTGSVSTGGTDVFSTSLLAARTITASNIPDLTIAVAITDPGHVHDTETKDSTGSGYFRRASGSSTTGLQTLSATTGITATGAFGTTERGGAQTALWAAVKYVDFIVAVKD